MTLCLRIKFEAGARHDALGLITWLRINQNLQSHCGDKTADSIKDSLIRLEVAKRFIHSGGFVFHTRQNDLYRRSHSCAEIRLRLEITAQFRRCVCLRWRFHTGPRLLCLANLSQGPHQGDNPPAERPAQGELDRDDRAQAYDRFGCTHGEILPQSYAAWPANCRCHRWSRSGALAMAKSGETSS